MDLVASVSDAVITESLLTTSSSDELKEIIQNIPIERKRTACAVSTSGVSPTCAGKLAIRQSEMLNQFSVGKNSKHKIETSFLIRFTFANILSIHNYNAYVAPQQAMPLYT